MAIFSISELGSPNHSQDASGCAFRGAKLTRFPFIAKTGFPGWSKSMCFTMVLDTFGKNCELRRRKNIVKHDTL